MTSVLVNLQKWIVATRIGDSYSEGCLFNQATSILRNDLTIDVQKDERKQNKLKM